MSNGLDLSRCPVRIRSMHFGLIGMVCIVGAACVCCIGGPQDGNNKRTRGDRSCLDAAIVSYGRPNKNTGDALEGGSPVGGHGDVFGGGSSWTVTGPLFDLPDLLVQKSLLLFIC